MILLEVPDKDWSFNFPEHLGECNPRQYAMVCRLLFQYHNREISFAQFKVAAVYQLLGMKPNQEEVKDDILLANIYDLTLLFESFFIEIEEGKYSIRQEFQHNPIPTIPLAKGRLYGPQDFFRGEQFGAYSDALNIMGLFNQTSDPALLYDLAAILYRPKGKVYDDSKVDIYAKRLKYTDFGYIYGVFVFLASFQHYLNHAKVTYEGKELDLSILFNSTETGFSSKLPGLGMKGTSYMLAETGILGNLRNVNETDLWEVLFLMYDIKKGDLDDRERAKQLKNERK